MSNSIYPEHWKNSALIVIGHGSTLNPDSAAPTHQHADAIRDRDLFAEVKCTFWKENPGMTDVLHAVDSHHIYLAPLFISEGYFTLDIIPREFALDGPLTRRPDRQIRYCPPVGIHRSMTDLLVHRAREVAPGINPEECTLFVVGHGTGLNDRSTEAIKSQVQAIRRREDLPFAAVKDAYMEEAPLISDWRTLSNTPNVIVVPFFIADGLHSYEDIPVMLGMEKEPAGAASHQEVFRHNPFQVDGRSLYYSRAIGTDPMMADVILDQVRAFDSQHRISA